MSGLPDTLSGRLFLFLFSQSQNKKNADMTTFRLKPLLPLSSLIFTNSPTPPLRQHFAQGRGRWSVSQKRNSDPKFSSLISILFPKKISGENLTKKVKAFSLWLSC